MQRNCSSEGSLYLYYLFRFTSVFVREQGKTTATSTYISIYNLIRIADEWHLVLVRGFMYIRK